MRVITPFGTGAINGQYRQSGTQASGGAVNAANQSNMGAVFAVVAPASYSHGAGGGTYESIEEAGIRAGEIIAYRAWALHSNGLLYSMYVHNYAWRPTLHPKADNFSLHGYGYHAFKSLDGVMEEYGYAGYSGTPVLFGKVALWGEVIEHSYGYRSEYARVHSLEMIRAGDISKLNFLAKWRIMRRLEATRKRYGVKNV